MAMTLKSLIKELQRIDKENPNKRLKVALDTKTAKEKYNDVFEIVEISDFKIDLVEMGDGDGFSTDKYHQYLLLS